MKENCTYHRPQTNVQQWLSPCVCTTWCIQLSTREHFILGSSSVCILLVLHLARESHRDLDSKPEHEGNLSVGQCSQTDFLSYKWSVDQLTLPSFYNYGIRKWITVPCVRSKILPTPFRTNKNGLESCVTPCKSRNFASYLDEPCYTTYYEIEKRNRKFY